MSAKPPKRPKRPRDFNQAAHQVFLESIGESKGPAEDSSASVETALGGDPQDKKPKNPHAVAMSELGARKGGKARASSMTPEERTALAKKAATARWGKMRQTTPVNSDQTDSSEPASQGKAVQKRTSKGGQGSSRT